MNLLSRKEELILIAIWKLGDNASGISIRDYLEESIGVKWLFGSIYTPLNKLYDKGFINKSGGRSATHVGERPKVFFKITPKGKDALAAVNQLSAALWTNVPPLKS